MEKVKKVKVQTELNLAKDVKCKNKCFFEYPGN